MSIIKQLNKSYQVTHYPSNPKGVIYCITQDNVYYAEIVYIPTLKKSKLRIYDGGLNLISFRNNKQLRRLLHFVNTKHIVRISYNYITTK